MTKTTTKTNPRIALLRAAAKIGAFVRFDEHPELPFVTVTLTAPDGFRFNATTTHDIVTSAIREDLPSVYANAHRDIADGITACDDTDCEICHETE